MHLEIQLILPMLWVWYLNIDPKSKNGQKVLKNDTKAVKARV